MDAAAAVAGLRRRDAQRRAAADVSQEAVLRALGVQRSEPAAPERKGRPQADEEELRALVASSLLATTPFEPLDSAALLRRLQGGPSAARLDALGCTHASLCAMLRRLDAALETEEYTARGEKRLMILHADAATLRATLSVVPAQACEQPPPPPVSRRRHAPASLDGLDSLIQAPSVMERQARAQGAALAELLCRPTAREAAAAVRFRSVGGTALAEYCPRLTREECRRSAPRAACERLHFVRLTMPHTDVQLGDCSFLDTCRHMRTCKYVHYALDPEDAARARAGGASAAAGAPVRPPAAVPEHLAAHPQPQWLSCDVRSFELGLLGQFGIIMADPPWDIHMELPYGTMSDDEMRGMAIGGLQTDGLMFLWVTGRAMELGRECLSLWGYRCVQELVWVKTNQLQRLIRTGRTGHWLNHSKEHCLVGIKGNPKHVNRHIDCDVLVAEVRETSRKPDEMYALLERLSPGTRKLEIFGREHNTRPGWVTLGNQLPGVRLPDDALRQRFLARYPEREGEIV
jgi:mRNA m6A methyltransferase catalytic subunit